MNKKNAELIWSYARLIYSTLRIKTDCFDTARKLVKILYIGCVDDDPKSAVYAAELYHQAVAEGQDPKVLCIGGIGLLSKHLKKKGVKKFSEGMRLAEFCMQLGVPADKIIILDHGTNSGENVKDIARQMLIEFGDIVFAVTQRLSLRWERTFKKQIGEHMAKLLSEESAAPDSLPQFQIPNSYYYVIEESLEEACCWMNGKKCCDGEMMLHELASIYDRCMQYSGTYQLPLDFDVPKDVKKAAIYLAQYYRIKNGKFGPREWMQYFLLYRDLMKHIPEMQEEEKKMISLKKIEFTERFGVRFAS